MALTESIKLSEVKSGVGLVGGIIFKSLLQT